MGGGGVMEGNNQREVVVHGCEISVLGPVGMCCSHELQQSSTDFQCHDDTC
jgi:hypothetical protein